MDFKVPFWPNTADDTHCFQAALRMVLGYFVPTQEYSWEELDQLTAKKEGLWTWPLAGLVRLQHMGFTIVHIELFVYERFIKEGEDYLYEFYGNEVGRAQIVHCDNQQERKRAKEFVKKVSVQKRIPTIGDIIALMNDGFLVICNINSHKLNQRHGYSGHFVVIKGYGENNLILHDPGLPPLEDRSVSKDIFEQSWGYPDIKAMNVMAFRYDP